MLTPQNNKQKTSFNNLLKLRDGERKIGPIPGTKNFFTITFSAKASLLVFSVALFPFFVRRAQIYILIIARSRGALFLTRRLIWYSPTHVII
jgi:hypothetical protein